MSKAAFADVVGNDDLRQRICLDILSGSFAHAYLLEGPRGCGKHTLALRIAMALSCESKHKDGTALPCMQCPTCKKILSGNSPDVILVNRGDKATLGVDPIRELRLDTVVAPNDLDVKVYVIEDAHLMTQQAQNALLLTLEEPPSYVVFLLLCETTAPILETVRSRAPTLRLCPVREDQVRSYLLQNEAAARELEKSAPLELTELLAASEGSIGQALVLLDPKRRKPILAERQTAREFVRLCSMSRQGLAAYRFLKGLPKGRDELISHFQTMLLCLRDLLLCKQSDEAPLCFFYDREEATSLAYGYTVLELLELCRILTERIDDLSHNANTRLTLSRLATETGLLALPG